jgi:anaerobic selenocysteine-containing dehydrogenase
MAERGVDRAALARGGLRKPEAPRVLFADRRFPTPSGRVNLIHDFPDEAPALEPGFPLFLCSNSTYKKPILADPESAQREPPVVTVHPESAGGRGEGDRARLVSPIAEVEVRLHLDPQQRRDVLIYPKGRWGKFGGPNALVRARITDAGEGAAYYDQGVRLE